MDRDQVGEMAAAVRQRAEALAVPEAREPLAAEFVKECLDTNERGDGCMFAAMHRDRFIYNTTPKPVGEWYAWNGHVWQIDYLQRSFAAVEDLALEYQRMMELLDRDIETLGLESLSSRDLKQHPDGWKVALRNKYKKRVDRLRSADGVGKVLKWAPVVAPDMACREQDFDHIPHLLPVGNGVVDLSTGALTKGRPEDKLTRALDLDYDPHAEYGPWVEFIAEITDDPEIAAFVKRSLGYASTGYSNEQYIWVFTGPGRNGKGVLFDLIGDVMRPYFHTISRAMLIEQRTEPSPSAASEHMYSLLGKRVIVGGETNRNQHVDMGAVKMLTGDDEIKCRPNFKSEITFKPSHTLFLHTQYVPKGLTKDFAMAQRTLKVEFPNMYVDDPEDWAARDPARANRYRKKDPFLKQRLREYRQGILRWLVEGAVEWREFGISPPESIKDAVLALAADEDYTTRFVKDCLVKQDDASMRISCKQTYDVFRWWWSENEEDQKSRRIPAMKTINKDMRDRGIVVDMSGGKTWIYGYSINPDIINDVNAFLGNS